jgi:hypothetical protein
MVDSLYADRSHVDDPHLWQRVKQLDLDLERFESDRRSDAVAARVRRDFESGIRAGVTTTPAIFESRGGPITPTAGGEEGWAEAPETRKGGENNRT